MRKFSMASTQWQAEEVQCDECGEWFDAENDNGHVGSPLCPACWVAQQVDEAIDRILDEIDFCDEPHERIMLLGRLARLQAKKAGIVNL